MTVLKEIFTHEVFPAVGCTEPISCAYAAAAAAELLPGPVERLRLVVDAGTLKNGAAVTVPNADGEKGNAIAAAIGAIIARPDLRLEILKEVTPDVLRLARELLAPERFSYGCREDERRLYVDVTVEGGGSTVRCVVADGHTRITLLERDGKSLLESHPHAGPEERKYREVLREMSLEDLLREVVQLDEELRAAIRRGVEMNLTISEKGIATERTGYQLQKMMLEGLMGNDLFYRVKVAVAAACDARMGGMPQPVMTSGGSGNQGILTILVPYLVGRDQGTDPARIEESIAVSHAVNSYIKCFTGELSVVCGCAIAASIASAIALVYQKAGIDMPKITFAVRNVIGDLCGIICDGAKPGCSMKIVSGADSAMRSAFMALAGYGLSSEDGVLGHSAEESIRNLSRISLEGMGLVDPTVVRILQAKSPRSGRA